MPLTKHQSTLLETLYDVATHEGGAIIIKNQYHSPAEALIKLGYVQKIDNWPYRPTYIITAEGKEYWGGIRGQREVGASPTTPTP